MIRSFFRLTKYRLAFAAVALLAISAIAAAEGFEEPPVLDAADVVDDVAGDIPLMSGRYTVDERVPTDGFMAEFTIVSDYGTFQASGPGMLATRINEIRALAALEHIEQEEQFQKGATESVKETGSNLQQLVEHPRETLESVPEGVGRFFERTYRAAKTGLQKVDDVRHGRTPGVDDDDPASQLPGGPKAPAGEQTESLSKVAARAAGDTALNTLGFDEDPPPAGQGAGRRPVHHQRHPRPEAGRRHLGRLRR